MKAIILARVSTKDQEEGLSIPAQVRRLTEYAEKKGLPVHRIFQITESSSKDIRKQFDEIIALIEGSKELIILITDTVDRLQRTFRETPILDALRKKGKLELRFLRENLILNKEANSAQLLQWDIGVLFASSYVRQLSDNVKRHQEQSLKSGEWTSKAPFGYKNVTLPSGKKDIIVDPETSPYVVKMFEMYASGNHSLLTITDEMSKLGLKNGRGNAILPSRIEVTLKNTFYYGIMCNKGEYYQHRYPRLISEWLFDKVQKMMGARNKAPVQFASKPMLLRGLITCQHCGCMVTGDIKKEKYTYYSCSNSKRICKKIWIREEKLLMVLLKNLENIMLPDTLIDQIVTHLKESYAHGQDFAHRSQQALCKELEHIKTRLSKLVDMHVDGAIDTDTYRTKMEEYKSRQREITSETQNSIDSGEICIITAQTVLDLAKNAKEIFESSNMSEKQQLLRFVCSNLTLDAEKLHVELHEPFLSMTKIAYQPVWLETLDTLRTLNWKAIQYHLSLLTKNILSLNNFLSSKKPHEQTV